MPRKDGRRCHIRVSSRPSPCAWPLARPTYESSLWWRHEQHVALANSEQWRFPAGGDSRFAALDTLSSVWPLWAFNIWSRLRLSCMRCISSCRCARSSSRSISDISKSLPMVPECGHKPESHLTPGLRTMQPSTRTFACRPRPRTCPQAGTDSFLPRLRSPCGQHLMLPQDPYALFLELRRVSP